jgi:hypothetical protein
MSKKSLEDKLKELDRKKKILELRRDRDEASRKLREMRNKK